MCAKGSIKLNGSLENGSHGHGSLLFLFFFPSIFLFFFFYLYLFQSFSKINRNGFAMNFKRAVAVCVYAVSSQSKRWDIFFKPSKVPPFAASHFCRFFFLSIFVGPAQLLFVAALYVIRSAFCTFQLEKGERLISVPTRCFAPIKSVYFLARMQSTVLNSANVSNLLTSRSIMQYSSILVVRISAADQGQSPFLSRWQIFFCTNMNCQAVFRQNYRILSSERAKKK